MPYLRLSPLLLEAAENPALEALDVLVELAVELRRLWGSGRRNILIHYLLLRWAISSATIRSSRASGSTSTAALGLCGLLIFFSLLALLPLLSSPPHGRGGARPG